MFIQSIYSKFANGERRKGNQSNHYVLQITWEELQWCLAPLSFVYGVIFIFNILRPWELQHDVIKSAEHISILGER